MATRHESEIEHGARIADDADSIWGWSSPAGQQRARRRAELLLSRAGARKGARILELGCGIGIFTELLTRSSEAAFVGIDISLDLLSRARARCPGTMFERGAIEALPHPAATFDAVIGSSILHHLDLGPALAEVRRVLKPGGRFVVAEPNMLNPQIMIQKNVPFVKRWAGDTPGETAFFRWRIARDLARAGFSGVEIEPYDFLHPMIPAPLISSMALLGHVLERLPVFREFAGSLIISAVHPGP